MPEPMDAGQTGAGQPSAERSRAEQAPTDPHDLDPVERRPDQPAAEHGEPEKASEAEGVEPHGGADVPGATRHLDAGAHPHAVPPPGEQEQADPLG